MVDQLERKGYGTRGYGRSRPISPGLAGLFRGFLASQTRLVLSIVCGPDAIARLSRKGLHFVNDVHELAAVVGPLPVKTNHFSRKEVRDRLSLLLPGKLVVGAMPFVGLLVAAAVWVAAGKSPFDKASLADETNAQQARLDPLVVLPVSA